VVGVLGEELLKLRPFYRLIERVTWPCIEILTKVTQYQHRMNKILKGFIFKGGSLLNYCLDSRESIQNPGFRGVAKSSMPMTLL